MTNNQDRVFVKELVDRIDNLETEKKAIADDIKDVYGEAKQRGLNKAALRVAVKRKRETAAQKAKRNELVEAADQYLHAIGLLD